MHRIVRWMLAAVLAAGSLVAVGGMTSPAAALDNGLARTPQMGWNDWNTLRLQRQRDAHPADRRRHGLQRHGRGRLPVRQHRRLLVDQAAATPAGTWSPTRRSSRAASRRSPTTSTARGSSSASTPRPGTTTCAGLPGQPRPRAARRQPVGVLGHRLPQVRQLRRPPGHRRAAALHRDARRAGGHRPADPVQPVQLGPGRASGPGARRRGNSWRTTGDISGNWNSVMGILDQQVGLEAYAGPGRAGTTRTCWRSATAADRDRGAGALQPLGAAERAAASPATTSAR